MRLFASLLTFAAPCHASPPCAETIRGLRALLGDPFFPLQWRETTMDDGKPLVPEKIVIGPAAHWAMRYALARDAHFSFTRIDPMRMKISTLGWSATFSTREAD